MEGLLYLFVVPVYTRWSPMFITGHLSGTKRITTLVPHFIFVSADPYSFSRWYTYANTSGKIQGRPILDEAITGNGSSATFFLQGKCRKNILGRKCDVIDRFPENILGESWTKLETSCINFVSSISFRSPLEDNQIRFRSQSIMMTPQNGKR